MSDAARPFVVLQSFPSPRPTTNPYVRQLAESLSDIPGVEVRYFSWRTALTRRVDVFHAHWPETLIEGRDRARRAVRQCLFLLLLLRLAITRVPLVRTKHNTDLPGGLSRVASALLRLAERRTTLWIRLNEHTPVPAGAPVETIPHGHYRDWFSRYPRRDPVPRRVAFVGQVRGYKGVERLIEAFRSTAGAAPDATLRVAGRPTSDELADRVQEAVAGDDRISLDLRFVPDADLVAEVSAAELVVLPYPEMHNSGGVLAALSLDRPVLVPHNDVNEALVAEVGREWVLTYADELTAADLLAALEAARAPRSSRTPALGAREWSEAGPAHLAAYRRAAAVLRPTARR